MLSPTGFEYSEQVLLLIADALAPSVENGFSKPYDPIVPWVEE